MTTATRARFFPREDLTEEVVFPLVRRRRPAVAIEEDESVVPDSRRPTRRTLLVQTIALAVFIAALAFCVLAWLAR